MVGATGVVTRTGTSKIPLSPQLQEAFPFKTQENERQNNLTFGNFNTNTKTNIPYRAPTPPVRYELPAHLVISKPKTINRSLRKYGTPKHKPGQNHVSSASFKQESEFTDFTATSESSPDNPIPTSQGRSRKIMDGTNTDEGDADADNVSLISMTGMLAEDVCQLQNLRFENIGPDIPQHSCDKNKNKNKKNSSKNNDLINMDVDIINFGVCGTKDAGNEAMMSPGTAGNNKSYSSMVWDNQPNATAHPTGNGTPETGSINSNSNSSPRYNCHPSTTGKKLSFGTFGRLRSRKIEVQIDNDSDNISEITPTGCAGLDGNEIDDISTMENKNSHTRGYVYYADDENNTSRQRMCCGKERDRRTPQDESFHGLLHSMARCLLTPEDIRDLRQTFSHDDAWAASENHRSFDREHSKSFDHGGGDTTNSYTNSSYSHPEKATRSRSMVRRKGFGSASAPGATVFKNNSDRYNQLVVGLMDNNDVVENNLNHDSNNNTDGRNPSSIERQHRKFTPAWFKSKRGANKRRNNTKILNANSERPQSPPVDEELNGCVNIEVVLKQSKAFLEQKNEFRSSATTAATASQHQWPGTIEAKLTSPPTKQQAASKPTKTKTRTPILQKLLKRNRSKESPDEEDDTIVRAVSITAKDPTRWKPKEDTNNEVRGGESSEVDGLFDCVATTVAPGSIMPVDLCLAADTNSLVAEAAAATGVSGLYLMNSRSGSTGKSTSPVRKVSDKAISPDRTGDRDDRVTRAAISPSVKNRGPVWRVDQDSPNSRILASTTKAPSSPTDNRNDNRKTSKACRSRCYHRNGEKLDSDDDDINSAPAMRWTESRSYEEDDCGRGEDIKVLSIVGHRDAREEGNDPRKNGTNATTPPRVIKAVSPPPIDSPFRIRHRQNLSNQPQRKIPEWQKRAAAHKQKNKASVRSGHSTSTSSAITPTSSSAAISTASSCSSSSSSPPPDTRRLLSITKKSNHQQQHQPSYNVSSLEDGLDTMDMLSPKDIEALQSLSENDDDIEFATALSAFAKGNASIEDNERTSGAVHAPWRSDYGAYMSSRTAAASNTVKKSTREPSNPPEIQRSSEPFEPFEIQPDRDNSKIIDHSKRKSKSHNCGKSKSDNTVTTNTTSRSSKKNGLPKTPPHRRMLV